MNHRPLFTAIILTLTAVASNSAAYPDDDKSKDARPQEAKPQDTRCYELRIYTAAEGKLDALNARFRDHTCLLFEKHGMTNVGYWLPLENPERKLYYILSYPSREAREASWKAFLADPTWKAAAKESEKDGKLVAGVEARFLHATDYSPAIEPGTGKEPRVFELRTYTCTQGNLPRLHARFRNHTMALFQKHGMTNFAYWELDADQPAAADTLVYLLAHSSKAASEASFKAFREDLVWKAAKEASEKEAGGSLTVKDGVKSVLMTPTDYSPTAQVQRRQLNSHVFTLPPGFDIEQVAARPLVDRPITADFDELGRLYVTDSSGSNDNVQKQLEEKPHRIVRLEDTDGDGRFDESTVFAEGMMFPEGTMWLDGSLYVSAPPSIWKLTDTDGDGQADERVEWFQGKTLTGCANDLHGPYAGPDGWIYWCKGAFAEQTYERPGRPPLVTRASHIFRCRPNGSAIEPVMTGGMDNPVDVVFTPGGERIFTTTFLQHPAGGLRDGLIHAIYGGVYGKVHAVIDGHPRTGPDVMPPLVHLGAAAPCGLTLYESEAFGEEYRDNLFAAAFNMQKITRHALTPQGGSFASQNEDFLVSSNLDFHPTDVLADADGSLIVVDTGGWYKLCCPTSQLHKPDLLGAIYRVRLSGAKPLDDPRGLRLDWDVKPDVLSLRLADWRPAVRRRAIEELGRSVSIGGLRRGEQAVGALETVALSAESAETRRGAVWAATRIEGLAARRVARSALADVDETVRQVAIHSVSVWCDHDALPRLLELLEGDSQHNRRAAAEALGRLGDPAAVPALLTAAGTPADRAVEHSLTFALIEIADRLGTTEGLASSNVLTQRAALAALDQMPDGGLTAETVAPFLEVDDAALKQTAAWIVGQHPDWGGALADHFRRRVGSPGTELEFAL